MPVVQHAVRAVALETRPVDHVGRPFHDRLDQPRILDRVVLQVGVLDDHDPAGGPGESRAQRRPLAQVPPVPQDAEALVPLHLGQHVAGAVRAAVVDHDDFLGNADRPNAPDDLANRPFLVVNGNDHRKPQVLGNPVDAQPPANRLAQPVLEPLRRRRRNRRDRPAAQGAFRLGGRLLRLMGVGAIAGRHRTAHEHSGPTKWPCMIPGDSAAGWAERSETHAFRMAGRLPHTR